MRQWPSRLRSAIGIGLTWAIAWCGAGLMLLLVVGLGAADYPVLLFLAPLGFLAGVTFSGILGLVEARPGFDQLSLPRIAACGGVGGLLLAAIVAALGGGAFLMLGLVCALSGAGCAAGSLVLARMSEIRETLAAIADMYEAGPAEGEAQ